MLPDHLEPNLDIVFVGINPGTYSDQVGHYFARPTNLFWPALHRARLVGEPLTPEDDVRITEFGYGLTDIVARATPNSSTITADEFVEGAKLLRARVEPLTPRIVCFVGLVGYRAGFDKQARLGEQSPRWGKTRLFIVPSTSPRNAFYRPQVIDWFKQLKRYRDRLIRTGGYP